MRKLFSTLIILTLLQSCNNEKNNSFIDESGFTVVGPKFNGKKSGRYIYYYPNGNLRGIYNYKDDCITGNMFYIEIDSSINRSYFQNCKPQFIYTISPTGDTLFYFKKNRMISYFKNKKIKELIYFGDDRNNDNKIIFDTTGKVIEFTYDELFLSGEDSMLLTQSYPNWINYNK